MFLNAGQMIGHLSRMAFASSSVDRFNATQGSDELLTSHSTFEGGQSKNIYFKGEQSRKNYFEGGQSKRGVDCNTCLQAKHVDDGVQLCQPELPLLIAAPEHKFHI